MRVQVPGTILALLEPMYRLCSVEGVYRGSSRRDT
jgi:hypothetical protein